MDELRTVREAYGDAAPPTMTEIARARARWEEAEAPPRRARFGWPSRLALGMVAAGAAAAVAVALTGQGTPHAPGPSGNGDGDGNVDLGRRAVLAAATKAERAPAGRYWYIDCLSGQAYIVRSKSGAPYAIVGAADEMFHWNGVKPGMGEMYYSRDLPARPATGQDAAVWRADGSPPTFRTWSGDHHATYTTKATKWRSKGPGVGLDPEGGGTFFLGKTAADLQRLPTDPAELGKRFLSDDALRALFLNGRTKSRGKVNLRVLPDMRLKVVATLLDAPTPPKVRAGLMRALAAQPGVHAIGHDTDPLGRRGVALAADPRSTTDDGEYGTPKSDQGTYRWRRVMIFDEGSGALLSLQSELVDPGGVYRDRKPGFVIDYETYRGSGWSDNRPRPPAGQPF